MLSERERLGLEQLLSKLTDHELFSMTNTVTNRVVNVENRQEAIATLLSSTDKASHLLRRKKVRKELLFHYLTEHGLIPSNTADKPSLIRQVMEYWGFQDSSKNSSPLGDLCDNETVPRNTSIEAIEYHGMEHFTPNKSISKAKMPKFDHIHVTHHHRTVKRGMDLDNKPCYQSPNFCKSETPIVSLPPQRTSSVIIHTNPLIKPSQLTDLENRLIPSCVTPESVEACANAKQEGIDQDKGQRLAMYFVPWFFRLLNSQNPDTGISSTQPWGPQHFCRDAKLKIHIRASVEHYEDYDGSSEVSNKLKDLASRDRFHFYADSLNAQGIQDSQDLVCVIVPGLVSKNSSYFGPFEQSFMLARDPQAHNTWRIQHTELKVTEDETEKSRKNSCDSNDGLTSCAGSC